MTELDQYWEKFIKASGRSEDDKCSGDLNFEAKGFVGNEKLALVLGGQKTAFFASWPTFSIDMEPLPVSGATILNRLMRFSSTEFYQIRFYRFDDQSHGQPNMRQQQQ